MMQYKNIKLAIWHKELHFITKIFRENFKKNIKGLKALKRLL